MTARGQSAPPPPPPPRREGVESPPRLRTERPPAGRRREPPRASPRRPSRREPRRRRLLRALRRADRPGVEARLRRRLSRRAPHLRLGARGERVAARALRRAGYRVVARNYRPGRPPAPELDVVAWEGDTLAVVEVKTRRGGLGRPMERVDEEKRRRLRRAAALLWRRESARRRIPPGSKLRLDVVEVWFPSPRPPARSRQSAPARLRRALATRFERPVVRIRRGAV